MSKARPAILFVCLGNICRSPLAEAAFRMEAQRKGLDADADSAGTGDWHIGHPPDRRAQAVARRNGVDIGTYRARQIEAADFQRFTHIFALDRQNLRDLKATASSDTSAEIGLLMDLVRQRAGTDVADPYYGDESGFDVTWSDVLAAARVLVARLAGPDSSAT